MAKGKIERFLDERFGIGGACNYEYYQINDALKVLAYFYSYNLGDVERESLLQFFTRMERDDVHYRQRVTELMDEAMLLRDCL